MNPYPYDYPQASDRAWPGSVLTRPQWRPGDEVEGWVTAEITPYPRPLNSLDEPFTAQFVLAVVEYPSGPVSQWGPLRWRSVEILLRSDVTWPVATGDDDAPENTPQLQRAVDELAQQAEALGWEPAGRGRTWCSVRFRRQYAQMRGRLRWR
jgi:hypothetical protein